MTFRTSIEFTDDAGRKVRVNVSSASLDLHDDMVARVMAGAKSSDGIETEYGLSDMEEEV